MSFPEKAKMSAASTSCCNCQFASVGVADNDITPDYANVTLCSTLDNVVTDEFEVMKSIDKQKSNCSSGPDGFPPIMFKQLKFVSVLHLHMSLISYCL